MIVVQLITTEWTKRSRGMPGAGARNAVPEAWPIQGAGDCDLLLQEVRFSEYDGFSRPAVNIKKSLGADALFAYRLEFERMGEGIAVYFRGDPWRPQYPMRKKVFILHDGEWARLISNGRKSLDYTWAYARRVFNIGITSKSAEECFSAGTQRPGYADEVQLIW